MTKKNNQKKKDQQRIVQTHEEKDKTERVFAFASTLIIEASFS